jgi:hypothetical protein
VSGISQVQYTRQTTRQLKLPLQSFKHAVAHTLQEPQLGFDLCCSGVLRKLLLQEWNALLKGNELCTHGPGAHAFVQVTPARLVCTELTTVSMASKAVGAFISVSQRVPMSVLSVPNTVIAA